MEVIMGSTADAISMDGPALGDRIRLAVERLRRLRRAPRQLRRTLENAEYLLSYAADAGIEVEPNVAQRIVSAKRSGNAAWDDPGVGTLMADMSKLAAKVHPATAETLRARQKIRVQIWKYTLIAIGLAGLIVPLSMVSFITTGISSAITTDLSKANDLVLKLHTDLDSVPLTGRSLNIAAPSSSLMDLQQFAITTRMVKDLTAQLDQVALWNRVPNRLTQKEKKDWRQFELPPNLPNLLLPLQRETNKKTALYQEVRRQATEIQDDVSVYYGAISACILPMLYALLGACAYLLRLFSDELNTGTFSLNYAISARFFIALIGGTIVGLFSNVTVGQGMTLPPLAAAFLVGYASDVFFSSLEGLLQNFKKAPSSSLVNLSSADKRPLQTPV
jgi:hypothetical protein